MSDVEKALDSDERSAASAAASAAIAAAWGREEGGGRGQANPNSSALGGLGGDRVGLWAREGGECEAHPVYVISLSLVIKTVISHRVGLERLLLPASREEVRKGPLPSTQKQGPPALRGPDDAGDLRLLATL